MNSSPPDRIDSLLREGWDLLQSGRSSEATLAFERILLSDPGHAGARAGLALASAARDESRRDHEARLDEAHRALAAGDAQRSRALLEPVAAGDERDRALALLDRLDARGGRLDPAPAAVARTAAAPPAEDPSRSVWLRRALFACWSLLLLSMGVGLAGRWQRILGGLLEPPVPEARGIPPAGEMVRPGERALEHASRLLAQGDAAGAVKVLSGVPADDPAYPLSQRLRLEAQSVLTGPEPRR